MERGHNGSFLARPSKSNPGDFTLSVRYVMYLLCMLLLRFWLFWLCADCVQGGLLSDELTPAEVIQVINS